MPKQAFISELKQALAHAPSHICEEIMADISEHFTEAIAKGMTEEDVCDSLGDPHAIAAQVLEEYGEPARAPRPAPQAEERADHEYAARDETFAGIRNIAVKLVEGSLRFVPAAGENVRVTLQGDTRHIRFNATEDGSLTIRDEKPRSRFPWFRFNFKGGSQTITVHVPTQFDGEIKAKSTAGNVLATGIGGRLHIKAAAGNVTVEDCRGRHFTLASAAGNIAADLTGPRVDSINISTAAGNATLTANEVGKLEVSSAAGTAKATITRLMGDANISTAAGSVSFTARHVEGDIDVSTAAGSAKVYLPYDANIRIKAKNTGFGSAKQEIPGNPNAPYTLRASSAMGSVKILPL